MKTKNIRTAFKRHLSSQVRAVPALVVILVLLYACTPQATEISNSESPISTGSAAQNEEDTVTNCNPLRVLIDAECAVGVVGLNMNGIGDRLVSNIKLSGGEIGEVEFEYLPKEGEERAAALTHMRTEVMTGKGPDLFICACAKAQEETQPLFRYPNQLLNQKLFLPLDDYFASAQFTDFDKLLPIAMEAGRNEEGQQLVPLAFTLPITVFRKSEVQHEHSKIMTRAEQVAGDDIQKLSAAVNDPSSRFRSAGFRDLADYEKETLHFSEEELLSYLVGYRSLASEQEGLNVPDYFSTDLTVDFVDSSDISVTYFGNEHHGGLRNSDAFTMVPLYSNEGGYTAYITSFAAINRNTEKPGEAFLLLDYLLSPAGARSELYNILVDFVGMPVHMDLGTEENPIAATNGKKWCLSQENYEEYCDLRDNISAMRFSTPIEQHFVQAYWNINDSEYERSHGQNASTPEKIVADAYRVMKMELAES